MNEEDRSRLEEFRQFRKEVRGSSEYLLVGIDVAKEKHYAFFGTAQGKTLFRRLVFENNLEGFRKLLAQAGAMKDQNGLKRVVFGMEPTANYHKPLGEHLIRCGIWWFWYRGWRPVRIGRPWMGVGTRMTRGMRRMWRIWYRRGNACFMSFR